MFKQSKKIALSIMIFVSFSNSNDILELNKNGIYSHKLNKIISSKIKFNEAVSYGNYIRNIKKIGLIFEYSSNSQYKKECYSPIKYLNEQYLLQYTTCFSFNINYETKPFWDGSFFALKKPVVLAELDKKTLGNIISGNMKKALKVSTEKYNKTLTKRIFYNLPVYNSNFSKVANSAVFELKSMDDNIYLNSLVITSLKTLEKTLKAKKNLKTYNKAFFKNLLHEKPIHKNNFTTYNNIAYYLQKAGANKEAIYLLEKIITKYPKRTVAYYNLGDAYWALGDKAKAKEVYKIYIKQMKKKGKQKQIPEIIKDRV